MPPVEDNYIMMIFFCIPVFPLVGLLHSYPTQWKKQDEMLFELIRRKHARDPNWAMEIGDLFTRSKIKSAFKHNHVNPRPQRRIKMPR